MGRVSIKMQERFSYAKEISDEILTGQSRHTVDPSMGPSLLFKGIQNQFIKKNKKTPFNTKSSGLKSFKKGLLNRKKINRKKSFFKMNLTKLIIVFKRT